MRKFVLVFFVLLVSLALMLGGCGKEEAQDKVPEQVKKADQIDSTALDSVALDEMPVDSMASQVDSM